MSLSSREIDSLEDIRIVMLARAQGACGSTTARIYANNLLKEACLAYGQGDLDRSIWLANREFQFNCRAFGFNHPFTTSSLKALCALKRNARHQMEALQGTALSRPHSVPAVA